MRYLFVSNNLSLLSLAWRVKEEGHNVILVTPNNEGVGIVDTYNNLNEALTEQGYDIGIVDGPESAKIRRELHHDFPTLGPTKVLERIQYDKQWAFKTLSGIGVPTPPVHKEVPDDKMEGSVDIWLNLNRMEPDLDPVRIEMLPDDATMQVRPKGTEFYVGACFNGTDFIPFHWGAIPYHRELAGDLGRWCYRPQGMSYFVSSELSPAHVDLFNPVRKLLRKTDFRGIISCRAYGTARDTFAMEYRSCIGLFAPLLDSFDNIAGFLEGLARGSKSPFRPRADRYASITMNSRREGTLYGLIEEARRHLMLDDVSYLGEDYVTSLGYTGQSTAWGKNFVEARRRAYRNLELLDAPSLGYRVDIGREASDRYKKLKDLDIL